MGLGLARAAATGFGAALVVGREPDDLVPGRRVVA
jgi:hypothetical protein